MKKTAHVTLLLLLIPALLTASVMSGAADVFSRSATALADGGGKTAVTGPAATTAPGKEHQARVNEAYGKLPMSFEANRGQADARVKFVARGNGYSLFLTQSEAVLSLSKSAGQESGTESPAAPGGVRDRASGRARAGLDVLRMKLVGANPSPRVAGLEELPGRSNYFIGNDPQRWQTDVAHFARVMYEGVYRGVDMVYYGNQRQLEYDFIVAPGADPSAIRMAFAGARSVELDAGGDLILRTQGGKVRQRKPLIYQETGGERREIAGRYVKKGKRQIGFEVGAYDTTKPLVIDPVLVYSTYLGGNNNDMIYGVAADGAGNTYVTGYTASLDFPTTAGAFQTAQSGGEVVFVTKLDASGSALVYSTYLDGAGSAVDQAYAIAVDSAGHAYVAGVTYSADFPTTAGAFDAFPDSSGEAFVTKLSTSGSSLVYSTCLGGSAGDIALDVALDGAGNAYVTGYTSSTGFPTTSGAFDTSYDGGRDAFVTKLNASGSALVYSTYLGGGAADTGHGIALDGSGNAYIIGGTLSTNFPTTAGALDTSRSGGTGNSDAFVTKLNASGSALVYSTYLGGSSTETGNAIAVDGTGHAYLAGQTTSNDYPIAPGAYDPFFGGNFDAFVTKLSPSGSVVIYSTYLGSGGNDFAYGIVVDAAGHAHVTGSTDSSDFPTTAGALDTSYNGGTDIFLTKLNLNGSALDYSAFFGGGDYEIGHSLAVDAAGNIYVAGLTKSLDLPTPPGAFDASYNGGFFDSYVAKFGGLAPTPTPTPTPTPCVNVALASNGGVATASSSFNSPPWVFTPAGAINGDRRGLNWGSGGGWNDDAPGNTFPDWLQIDFPGPRSLVEIDVFTGQDNYANPSEPTEAMTFTQYGLTGYEVQYWDGASWATVPGGGVSGNNKVWRKFTFAPLTTSKIRVLTHASVDGYSRITQVEAYTPCGAPTPTPTPTPCPTIGLSPQTAPAGTVGSSYSLNFAPTGGSAPYTFAASGNLPPGLSLSPASGQLAGVPTAIGTFNFTVTATDANGCTGSRSYTVVVDCPLITLAPASLPAGTVGAAYDQLITAAGGMAPYSFMISGGLPPGLSLDAAGRLSGTPSADGSFDFNVVATDAFGCSGTAAYTVNINPAATPTPTPTPNSCNVALAASGTTATASSQFGFPGHPSGFYPASGVIDGEHDGNNWGEGGGWNDTTNETFPDSVEVNFNAVRTIQEIHVYTLKNVPNDGSTVNDWTPANVYGIRDFRVEYYDGSNFQNVLGGVITANTFAKRRFVFPAVTTDRIRVVVNNSADHLFSRIVEVEAYTCTPGCPAPTPQGNNWRIAFESNRDGNSEIYLADADGRDPVRLTNDNSRDGDPFFSPDGARIVFPTNRHGNYEIYVMNADGTNQTRLTNNSVDDFRPAFSPDGSKLVFYRNSGSASEIYVMNADGTNQVRLTNNSSADMFPKWSPDGAKLVFHSDRDGDFEIYVMNADGSNLLKLTNNNSSDHEASFSPGGSKILFSSDRTGNTEVWVMNADGSQLVNLSNSSNTDGSCAWSADGTKILFVSARDGNTEVYAMNPDGSGQTRLTVNNVFENTPVSGFVPRVNGAPASASSTHAVYSLPAINNVFTTPWWGQRRR